MISSTSNAQIKNIIQLQAKSKAREKQNCFIVEGIRMFMEVPATDIIKIYVAESFFVKSADNVKEKIKASEYVPGIISANRKASKGKHSYY